MPVGLFMNKIETLHTAVNSQVDMTDDSRSPNSNQTPGLFSNNDFISYSNKFCKNNSDQDASTEHLFLDLNNDSGSNNNNIRIESTLLSPMSIPVAVDTQNNTTNNLFHNSFNENFNNNNSMILEYMNSNNSIPNDLSNNSDDSNELVEGQINNNNELVTEEVVVVRVRNNIDFAIDAVLDKCRNTSHSSEDDEMYELITSKSSNKRAKSTKKTSITPVDSQPASVLVEDQTSNNYQATTDILQNSINEVVGQQQQAVQQPMSKSSKARTSYISSLIANRQKTPVDDSSPHAYGCQNVEDDKQKRISQNILTILANNKNHQQQYTETTSNASSNLSSPRVTNELNTSKSSDTCTSTKFGSKAPGKARSSNKAKKQNLESACTSSQEIDFVMNLPEQSIQLNNNFINIDNMDDEARQRQINKNSTNYSQTYSECDNLKRLLSQPSMDAVNLNSEFVNSQAQMKTILMERSSDHVQIEIKHVLNNNNIATSHGDLINNDTDSLLEKIIDSNVGTSTTNGVKVGLVKKETAKRKRPTKAAGDSMPRAKKVKAKVVAVVKSVAVEPIVQLPTVSSVTNNDMVKAEIDLMAVSNIQDCISRPHVTTQPLPTKSKKLKTIADIVKHNSETQRNKFLHNLQSSNQAQSQPPQQPQIQQQPLLIPHLNDTFTNDMSNINIDHLLELQFNSVIDPSIIHNQQLIDKYIDLDDIDLNPLECYRQNTSQTNFTQNNNIPSNQLDEFNFQFSVCSSSSSGFSEPSNFSTCSQNGYTNSHLNNSHIFNNSSESESSPPINYSNQFDNINNNNRNSPQPLPPSYNLFQKTSDDSSQMVQVNGNGQFSDWSIGNNNNNNGGGGTSNGDSLFENFSFLCD